MSDLEARLRQGAELLGIDLIPEAAERMLSFLVLVERWGSVYNLTAIRDRQTMLTHHLLDSLAIRPFLFGESVLDLGTGAGLPGLPLAMATPELLFCLVDASRKRIRFVRQATIELGLANVHSVQARIEAYRPGRNFSTIAARAVSSICEIHDWAAPLLASPGRLLLMKGRYPADELEAAGLAGLECAVHRLHVPYLDAERHLIEIRRD